MAATQAECRRLLFWNRIWLALLLITAVGWGVARALDAMAKDVSAVRAHWEGDTLRFSSLRGQVVVSHLEGYSQDRPVGTPLPTPAFILDSGGAMVSPEQWKALVWRDDAGNVLPAPAVGSRITGLYVRLDRTRWRGERKP